MARSSSRLADGGGSAKPGAMRKGGAPAVFAPAPLTVSAVDEDEVEVGGASDMPCVGVDGAEVATAAAAPTTAETSAGLYTSPSIAMSSRRSISSVTRPP